MNVSSAIASIRGISPYSQSRQHDAPKFDKESHDDYDRRTWREKLNLSGDGKSVVIPAHAMHQCIAAGAKYSKRQIPGQGKATWTAKFLAGIMIADDIRLDIDPASVDSVTISANADGVRGSGKRVPRRFPIMPEWSAEFEVFILDDIITPEVFKEMLTTAGMFIGIGRFRPEKGGINGRFAVEAVDWNDRRKLAA